MLHFGLSKNTLAAINTIENLFSSCEDQEVKEMVAIQVEELKDHDRSELFRLLDNSVGVINDDKRLSSYTLESQNAIKMEVEILNSKGIAFSTEVRTMWPSSILNPDMTHDFMGKEITLKDRVNDSIYKNIQNF